MLEIKVGLGHYRELGINHIANCGLQTLRGNIPFSQVERSTGAGGFVMCELGVIYIPNLAGWCSFPMAGFSQWVYHIGFY